MCIGGPYCMGLIQAASQRVASAILFQTIGLSDNRQAFFDMFDGWAAELKPGRPEVSDDGLESFKQICIAATFSQCLQRIVSQCQTPLLVLLGNDLYHPQETLPRDCRARPKRNPG